MQAPREGKMVAYDPHIGPLETRHGAIYSSPHEEKKGHVFVGYCANEEQARRGWEALGSPGEFETYSKSLQRLEASQFMFRDGKSGRIDIVVMDAEGMANLVSRERLLRDHKSLTSEE